jgi:hypothetical protein
MIAGFLACVCGISGLIVGIIVTKGFVKYGLSTPQGNATEQSHAPAPD